jgi:hypothetical protein
MRTFTCSCTFLYAFGSVYTGILVQDGNLLSRAKDIPNMSVLLVQGTQDRRVHVSHSMALAKVQ